MLLQKLREYSERLDLPPKLYSELAVRYIIDLDSEGRFLGMIDTADPSTPRTRRGQLRRVPEVQRAAAIKPLLLCDKADYVLGYAASGARTGRVVECHRSFLDLLERCAADAGEEAVKAVLRFLVNDPLNHMVLLADFDASGRIAFRVDGQLPTELRSVQRFWATVNDPEQAGAPVMQCLICGRSRPVLNRLQGKIKGIPGGRTAGTSVISANAEAFESYGLQASLIAPTCADCGERFTKAANELLASPTSRRAIAGAAFIWWTREPVVFNLTTLISDASEDEVAALLESVYSGRPTEIDATRLYATVLSGSGGRTVVRDWIETTVGDVRKQLALWFQRQRIVDAYGERHRPLGLTALAGATVRELRDLTRPTTGSLLRAALTGAPLPLDLLYQAVRRNRAEQGVTRPRAALIKLVLSSQENDRPQEDTMVRLDPEITNAAYRCGRLLAVLEAVQRRAIPGVSATIVDRFFGTASSAPASVFGRLLRGAQPHLAKIERDQRGLYFIFQRAIEEICDGLPLRRAGTQYFGFPSTLSLQDQGSSPSATTTNVPPTEPRCNAVVLNEPQRTTRTSKSTIQMMPVRPAIKRLGSN